MAIYHYAVRREQFWVAKKGKDVFKELTSNFGADKREAVLAAHEMLREPSKYKNVKLLRREVSPWQEFSAEEGFPDEE